MIFRTFFLTTFGCGLSRELYAALSNPRSAATIQGAWHGKTSFLHLPLNTTREVVSSNTKTPNFPNIPFSFPLTHNCSFFLYLFVQRPNPTLILSKSLFYLVPKALVKIKNTQGRELLKNVLGYTKGLNLLFIITLTGYPNRAYTFVVLDRLQLVLTSSRAYLAVKLQTSLHGNEQLRDQPIESWLNGEDAK